MRIIKFIFLKLFFLAVHILAKIILTGDSLEEHLCVITLIISIIIEENLRKLVKRYIVAIEQTLLFGLYVLVMRLTESAKMAYLLNDS